MMASIQALRQVAVAVAVVMPAAMVSPTAVAGGTTGGAAARSGTAAAASLEDPRIRRIEYSPDAVVTVHTRRGQVTHLVLAADEQLIGDPATGQGANCEEPQHTWCVTVGETRRDIFVKPREGALPNNLSVITSRRRYAFELVPIERGLAAMRVVITLPPPAPVALKPDAPRLPAIALPEVPPPLSADELVANRMRAAALVRNAEYSVALGPKGEDLVPSMVFDDGRATYFRFAGNAPLPAIFMTAPDGSEETVNTRMNEDGLLVTDRVGKRFVLRLGDAAAAVINEAFDREGYRPKDGTAVPGVARVVVMDKSSRTSQDTGDAKR